MASKKRKTVRRPTRKAAASKQRSHARHAVLAKRKRPAKTPPGLRTLYPAIKPYKSGMLRVADEHEPGGVAGKDHRQVLEQRRQGGGPPALVVVSLLLGLVPMWLMHRVSQWYYKRRLGSPTLPYRWFRSLIEEFGRLLSDELWRTEDHREGVMSHVEKRKPHFKAR